MTLKRLILCISLLLCSASLLAQEPATDAPTVDASPSRDQAKCYTNWDESYFYVGLRIDCPDVRGSHKEPNAQVSGDDVVEIYFQTGDRRSSTLTPNCFLMAVSAAGGAQFSAGNDKGTFDPATVWSFKYGVNVQGTLNNDGDVDQGYSIEIAIPWELMKSKAPQLGDMIGFNIIIRRHDAKPGDFVSISPNVKTEADVLSPSKWMPLVCTTAYSFGGAMAGGEKIISPKTIVRPPLINGLVDDREWPKNALFSIDLPVPEGFVYEAKFPPQRMTFTHYFYWYQADPRKGPLRHIVDGSGQIELQDFPIKGAGPWFSTYRVQWHKEQLSDILAAGIDVVLPIYWGDKTCREEWSVQGLDCLIAAISELKAEGKPYPLVGMFFDTTAMQVAYGTKPDLKQEEVKRTFYGMIKDFFDRVPTEYRAFAQAGKPYAGEQGPIVFLYTSGFLSDYDETFAPYCSERFKADFGSPIVWVGSGDFEAKAAVLDAYSSYGAGLGPISHASGRIKMASVGAGFDDSAVAVNRAARIRSRMAGETYDKDWETALSGSPQWMVCDGWNELHEGSDICPSREYGRKYVDATKANIDRFTRSKDYDVQFLRCDLPRVIPPKQISQAEVTVKNTGNVPWRASEGYALGYRWYKTGRYIGESKNKRAIEKDVAPGQSVTLTIGIATVIERNQALAEGDCEVRLEMVRQSDGKCFSSLGGQALILPITIGKTSEWGAKYPTCTAPVLMASGPDYPVRIYVRNDGSTTWRKGVAKLGCRLYKVSNYTHGGADDTAEEVQIDSVRAVLAKDCKPGDVIEIAFPLALTRDKKKTLPAWSPEAGWSYQLQFDIYNGEKWLSELGCAPLRRTVSIIETDSAARIVDSNIPAKLSAGQTYEAKVVLFNAGATKWQKKKAMIGYHWYHLDGTEMQWECPATPINVDVNPHLPTVVTAKVTAPLYDGRYVLAWDVMVDDVWLSTLPVNRGGDLLPTFVEVTGGKLSFVDLTGVYDVAVTSPDTNRTLGDFDGKGTSFPSEFMPPDAGPAEGASHIYPAGYNYDRAAKPEGRISFRYPDKIASPKSAVACSSQKLQIEAGKYVAVHILAASSNGSASGELTLGYSEGAASSVLAASDWRGGPANGEAIGYRVRHLHSHGGDEPNQPGYLYHYVIALDSSKTLGSITLPKSPDIKIVAVTLERVSAPAPPAAN